jgi:anti-anti-sigma factor
MNNDQRRIMFEHTKQGAIDVVFGGDPLHGDHVERLRALLEHYIDEGQPHVVLDLQGVPLIDSCGLELLLEMHERYKRVGGALKLSNVSQLCGEILKITGVGQHFEIYPDTGAAVGSFVR